MRGAKGGIRWKRGCRGRTFLIKADYQRRRRRCAVERNLAIKRGGQWRPGWVLPSRLLSKAALFPRPSFFLNDLPSLPPRCRRERRCFFFRRLHVRACVRLCVPHVPPLYLGGTSSFCWWSSFLFFTFAPMAFFLVPVLHTLAGGPLPADEFRGAESGSGAGGRF